MGEHRRIDRDQMLFWFTIVMVTALGLIPTIITIIHMWKSFNFCVYSVGPGW